MNLNEIYSLMEDKWYGFLDKIDAHVPIYKVIDPIDKIVPSFILVLFIMLLILVAVVLYIISLFSVGAPVAYVLEVVNENNETLPNVIIELESDETSVSVFTGDNGKTNEITTFVSGTSVTIRVEESGYDSYNKTITWDDTYFTNGVYQIGLTKPVVPQTTWRFYIQDKITKSNINESMLVSFACVNGYVTPPISKTVTNGSVEVTEPDGCGGLIVSVTPFSNNYESVSSFRLSSNGVAIYLSPKDVAETNATVNVYLKFDGEFIEEPVPVTLRRNSCDYGLSVGTKTAENGQASFEVPSGTYCAVSSGTANYASASSETITVGEDETKAITLNLTDMIAGYIKVQVVKESDGKTIDNALVTLKTENSHVDEAYTDKDENSLVTFTLKNDVTYNLTVHHEDYCLKNVDDVKISDEIYVVKLEKYTEKCGSTLYVKVVDEDSEAVNNATVGLFTEDRYSLGFKNQISDINGNVEFRGVNTGKYTAFAYKGAFSGWSEVMDFEKGDADKQILIVPLYIPDGTINVKVTDRDGEGIQFAEVRLMDVASHEVIGGGAKPVESVTGDTNFTIKADKRVYAVVRMDGYTDYTSEVYDVPANASRTIHAILEPEIISGDVEIEFLGLYTDSGEIAAVLA
ncbi:MAG: hypothetical protein V1672_03035, partial [Candidatus Diapherotrites archaeon]